MSLRSSNLKYPWKPPQSWTQTEMLVLPTVFIFWSTASNSYSPLKVISFQMQVNQNMVSTVHAKQYVIVLCIGKRFKSRISCHYFHIWRLWKRNLLGAAEVILYFSNYQIVRLIRNALLRSRCRRLYLTCGRKVAALQKMLLERLNSSLRQRCGFMVY